MTKDWIAHLKILGEDSYIGKKGETILVPISASNRHNASLKIENAMSGSEYPSFDIIKIEPVEL